MKRENRWLLAAIASMVLATSLVVSPAGAIPPDPTNAGLLYYQAFLSLPDLDKEARDHITEVAKGTVAPNDKTRKYVEECHAAIVFADAAKPLQMCDCGFRYSQGSNAMLPYLAQIRFLSYVLLADARILALDGNYRGALERCVQIRTFSRHIGDDPTIAYLVGMSVQRLGYECMDDVVGLAATDMELLRWLKHELAFSDTSGLSPIRPLRTEMESGLAILEMDKLDQLSSLGTSDADVKDWDELVASIDAPTMERARRMYSQYVTSALAILNASKSYEQAYLELTALDDAIDTNDPASAVTQYIMPHQAGILSVKTAIEANSNAMKAAVDICLQRAETGRLPNVLPAGLPKDPFSGQDFQYERTSSGFVLRCRGKDLAKDKVYEYAFTVK